MTELNGEAPPRPVEPDRNGICTDPENASGIGVTEPLPCEQAKQLLIISSKPRQGIERPRRFGGRCGTRIGLTGEPKPEPDAASTAATQIGDHPPCDREEPWQ